MLVLDTFQVIFTNIKYRLQFCKKGKKQLSPQNKLFKKGKKTMMMEHITVNMNILFVQLFSRNKYHYVRLKSVSFSLRHSLPVAIAFHVAMFSYQIR